MIESLDRSGISKVDELGGHSSVWAKRSQYEGCKVFTATQSSKVIDSQLKVVDDNSLLLWPKDDIQKLQTDNDYTVEDLHFVFEYREGDSILGGRFTAPRSNRFYFVQDPNGGSFKQLEIYHKLVAEQHPEIKRHMFGGFQIMQKLTPLEAEERLSKMA